MSSLWIYQLRHIVRNEQSCGQFERNVEQKLCNMIEKIHDLNIQYGRRPLPFVMQIHIHMLIAHAFNL